MKFWRYFFLLCLVPAAQTVLAKAKTAERDAQDLTALEFREGRDYFSYKDPIAIEQNGEQKIRIQSFFDYDCRVCINTQDILALYSQINPNSVILEEYPVATPKSRFSAQVYYSLKRLNHEDLSDLLLFETSDAARYREISKYENLLAWLREQQVDTELFGDILKSDEIAQKVEQAIGLTEKYGVFTYPFVAIDGKYVLTNSTLYNDDYTFAVLDFLVHKLMDERNE